MQPFLFEPGCVFVVNEHGNVVEAMNCDPEITDGMGLRPWSKAPLHARENMEGFKDTVRHVLSQWQAGAGFPWPKETFRRVMGIEPPPGGMYFKPAVRRVLWTSAPLIGSDGRPQAYAPGAYAHLQAEVAGLILFLQTLVPEGQTLEVYGPLSSNVAYPIMVRTDAKVPPFVYLRMPVQL